MIALLERMCGVASDAKARIAMAKDSPMRNQLPEQAARSAEKVKAADHSSALFADTAVVTQKLFRAFLADKRGCTCEGHESGRVRNVRVFRGDLGAQDFVRFVEVFGPDEHVDAAR